MKTFYQWIWCFMFLCLFLVPGFGMYDMTGSNPGIQLYRPLQVQYTPDPTPGITPKAAGILDIIVVDSITREPVNDVRVAVSTTEGITRRSYTNEDGVVTIDHSDYTATTALLSKSGYEKLVIDANTSGIVEFVAIVSDPGYYYEVQGTVVDLNTGAPLPDAKVYFSSTLNNSYMSETAYTDETGLYFLTAEAGLTAKVTVSLPGYVPDTRDIEPGITTINFTIDQILPGAGDVWIYPSHLTVRRNRYFDLEIHVNTGTQSLAAYGMDVYYNQNVLSDYGYKEGADGFVAAMDYQMPGEIRLSGFDTSGTCTGEDIHLVTMTFLPIAHSGSSNIDIEINEMVDILLADIGIINPINDSVTITAPAYGDVNNDTEVDIVDALLVARYYVSGDPSILDLDAADVNSNGSVDIIDALRIAQFYVDLIRIFG